jgi:hypothetical protein
MGEDLLAVYEEAKEEARRQQDYDADPAACPNDGTILDVGPDGRKFCPFDGWRP